MFSDNEICTFYKIDEDDSGMIEDIRFLLDVELLENHLLFNSREKLQLAHGKLINISHRILDGTRSDALCDLLDNTFYAFRQRQVLIESIVENEIAMIDDAREEKQLQSQIVERQKFKPTVQVTRHRTNDVSRGQFNIFLDTRVYHKLIQSLQPSIYITCLNEVRA
jgi:hypothetical protein